MALAPAPEPEPLPAPSTGPASRLPVLVVDDNPINLKVASGLVERAGCVVRQATSGPAAVEAVARESFSVVLMDCDMPDMDGLEATRRIVEQLGAAAPRIVALTAAGQSDEVAACLAAGMSEVLVKPVTLAQLMTVLGTSAPPVAPAAEGSTHSERT
ncbi:MAG: response regulator [Myxococcota bacterium]